MVDDAAYKRSDRTNTIPSDCPGRMANIRAEPAVVKSFVLNIIKVRHLSEFNCIDPNDPLE